MKKIAFLDRDGTLIAEPPDHQIDSLEKFRLVDGAIPALLQLKRAGYRFVMVSNQDGLGGRRYPQAKFEMIQKLLLGILASQGIEFDDVLICKHLPEDRCSCRKPALGLLTRYLADPHWDRRRSCVIGDRDSDLALAEAMGVRGFKLGYWKVIVRALTERPRVGQIRRDTKETRIAARVDLDGSGECRAKTSVGFFDHMLEQLAKHSGFDLELKVDGDLHVDEHHTVEDVALAIGAAVRQALGDKVGIGRYGFYLPMDEASATAALDLGGRPYFKFDGRFARPTVGGLPTEMVPHFFRSLAEALGANLHLTVRGENTHHMIEASFKAVARSLRMAAERTREGGLPSTKGML